MKAVLKLPVVDLFSGCGGLSRGFQDAGFDVVAAYDGWDAAVACYNANFDHEAKKLDLNDVELAINTVGQHQPNIIIGGPPCQEFSNAGKREEGARADLTFKYAQIITSILPEYFVMENVPRVRESVAYGKARELYINAGYGLTELVLDASRCGVPQSRKRFFCIGGLNQKDNFLLDEMFMHQSDEEYTVRKYFADHEQPLDIRVYYRHPTTYTRRAIFDVDSVAPTIRGVNRPKPSTYKYHPDDAATEEERDSVRSLTQRERATIQTFPTDFTFDVKGLSNGDKEQMIGNAVPVVLAQYVATRLFDFIEGGNVLMDGFAAWLREEKKYSDRSISDVFSRLNRAKKILPDRELNRYFMADLEANEEYKNLGTSVRSQIKKAVQLQIAYSQLGQDNA